MSKKNISQDIKSCLKDLLRNKAVKIAVAYKDLNSGGEFLHNPDHVFPAASVIKIPVLLEYLRQVEYEGLDPLERVELTTKKIVGGSGILSEMEPGLTPTLCDMARLMIVVSDNTATNILIDRIGMKNVNRFLRSQGLKMTGLHRRLMIVPGTKIQKNFITAREMMMLLTRLYRNEALPALPSKEALEILSRQQHREKIPRHLPLDLRVANKPGEITGVCHDAAIIFVPGSPYVLCIFTEGVSKPLQGDEIIGEISHELFRHIVEE